MKFAQILALAGSAVAATYSNSSFVPYGSGYFFDSQIYLDIVLPNSGFSGFSIASGANNGFTFVPESFSGVYAPSGTPFEVTSASSAASIDISADVDFSAEDKSAEISISGPIETELEFFVGEFVVNLEGLPQLIEKRADQEFTITITATSSVPNNNTTTTTSSTSSTSSSSDDVITTCSSSSCATLTPIPSDSLSTKTATSTTIVTITSCEDDKCHETTVPTGVTVVTIDSTVYTTYCPITVTECTLCTSITKTKTIVETVCSTSDDVTITEKKTYTTTVCDYYSTAKPTGKPTTEVPTTKAPTTEVPTTKAPTTEVPTTKAPTTEVPTTKAPTTEVPTTKAPTTEAPTTKAPTTEAPTTEVPVVPTVSSVSTGSTATESQPIYEGSAAKIGGSLFAGLTVLLSMLL